MKKILFLIISVALHSNFYSQRGESLKCGTDELMRKHYKQYPEQKAQSDAFDLELSKLIKSGNFAKTLNKKLVYEIPIVVHVVGDGSAIGTINNRSDADIIAWINYTNGIFAGTSTTSAVLPVKFVFAKVNPSCVATNGINRINASHLPKYVSGGVNDYNTTNAVSSSEITALGMWDTGKYYNIYVVKNLHADGFAYLPGGNKDYAFMATGTSTVNNQTLVHEAGHALGLLHTHEGFDDATAACPPNTDCTLQGDRVCDTEPVISLIHSSIPYGCLTGQTNTCTGQTFAGGERNVMAYSDCPRDLFTQGQVNRAIAQLLQYRTSLINSPVASSNLPNNNSVLAAVCTPSTITNPGGFNVGITSVKFANINNYSPNYLQTSNNFYENFSENYCLGSSKTTIPAGIATTLTVAPGTSNLHVIKAYIDYNNNGQFNETTERILNKTEVSSNSVVTVSVTPPANAVKNKALRMRVIGEFNGTAVTACYTPKYGQVEDYSVIITPSNVLSTAESNKNELLITKINQSVFVKSDSKISSLSIYDASGRVLVNQTDIKTSEFSAPLQAKNTIVTVHVILENGNTMNKKIKF